MITYTGGCLYCGQIRTIQAKEGLTEEEISKLATMECNCDEALEIQRCEQKKTYADANIKELFKDDGQTMMNLLLEATQGLSRMNIQKLSVVSGTGIKAVITAKKGSIKVERIESKKDVLED